MFLLHLTIGLLINVGFYIFLWLLVYVFFYIEMLNPMTSIIYTYGIGYMGIIQFFYLIPLTFFCQPKARPGYLLSAFPFVCLMIYGAIERLNDKEIRIFLDTSIKDTLLFSQLSPQIKDFMIAGAMDNRTSKNTFDWFFSTNHEKIQTEVTTLKDGLPTLMREGENVHFYIKDIHFLMSRHTTSFYVLDSNYLYYPKGKNIPKIKIDAIEYYRIDLSVYWDNR